MNISHPFLESLLNGSSMSKPEIAVILGSGLGSFTEEMDIIKSIPYEEIEGFPKVTVAGHSGEMIYGKMAGKFILAAKGRFHYYEGYNLDEILTLMSFFKDMQIKSVIVTNAAGLINTEYNVGDFLFIDNCIDFTGLAEQVGDIKFSHASKDERHAAMEAAAKIDLSLGSGTYVWTTGPSYETPAEISYMLDMGGDLVGMSTMPEIIYARKNDMKVYPLSCATNFAAGISEYSLSHEEVFETAERVKEQLSRYISELIRTI